MRNPILTKIDREILRLDPEIASRRQLKDLVWARSTLDSASPKKEKPPSLLTSLLLALKECFQEPKKEIPPARPTLQKPEIPEGTYRPPRFFAKGAKEKPMAPIPYLLIETHELSKARPVPGNSLFLRSLAKGKGVLKKNDQGLFYLDIDNRFVLSLIPYLKAFGLIRPPYFTLFSSPEGAHIPIIPPREAAFHYLDRIADLGQEFTFEIEGLYSSKPTLWPEVEEVWFFKVRSLELEGIRKRQFLVGKPGGHSFHIAVAIKPRSTKMRSSPPLPMMRVNVAFFAA